MEFQDTIVAPATPQGVGAIGVIRLSGPQSIALVNTVFKGKNLSTQVGNTIHFGRIVREEEIIDEVLVSLFKAPKSYTKEDVIEISCHGSPYIQESILQLLVEQGARLARAGEFTQRAFLNGAFDLAQAEAVADLIASDSKAAQQAAMHQLRGGFSKELALLREQLIHFASLIELELDFGEEDVEFADRDDLRLLVNQLIEKLGPLINSFKTGNAIKNGVSTVIIGKPNAGKSTLLNALLNEEKAIVSDIAGTTRDSLEDEWILGGVRFRLVDTAGLRQTSDVIEAIGVERTQAWVKKAQLVLYMADASLETPASIQAVLAEYSDLEVPLILIINKMDLAKGDENQWHGIHENQVMISAKEKMNLHALEQLLLNAVGIHQLNHQGTLVTNIRHYQKLLETQDTLEQVLFALNSGLTGDLVAQDLRHALYHLGEITGQISNDDLLKNIFGKFCIGK
jgi:tRNA modification GTPase